MKTKIKTETLTTKRGLTYRFLIYILIVTIQNREARVENRDGFVVKIEMNC